MQFSLTLDLSSTFQYIDDHDNVFEAILSLNVVKARDGLSMDSKNLNPCPTSEETCERPRDDLEKTLILSLDVYTQNQWIERLGLGFRKGKAP